MLDATVTRTEARFRGVAAKYVAWEVASAGGTVTNVPSEADVVLATVVSPHEWECFPRALRRIGVEPSALRRTRDPIVVLGGQAGLSPSVFSEWIDIACVGEGRTMLRTLVNRGVDAAARLPNAWVPGETRRVAIDEDFPWDAPPTMAEDGIVRVYASRGCRKKCLFCHTGWATSYRERPSRDVGLDVDRLRAAGYRVNVITNDAPALGGFGELALEHFSASYSQMAAMLANLDLAALRGVRSVRFGVEAPSSRLRRLVGKPVDTMALFECSARLLAAGIGVRWFLIAGLPGECDGDYDELRDVVLRAKHDIRKGALQLSFTAFCPDSAAPLCLAPLDDEYWTRYERFHHWFFEREGYTRRIQLFRCAGPAARLRHAIGAMAADEQRLRAGWARVDPPNWRVDYPYLSRARLAYDVYASRAGLRDRRMASPAPGEPFVDVPPIAATTGGALSCGV